MRSWLKALLISVVILAAGIFFLPSLAKQGINSVAPWVMAQANLKQAKFHISNFSWRKLSIDHIQFQLPAENSTQSSQDSTDIKVKHVDIHFSVWDLLAAKVKQINIDQVQLELPESDNKHAKNAQPQNHNSPHKTTADQSQNTSLTLARLDQVFQQLPMQRFNIRELVITHPQAKVSSQIDLSQEQLTLNSQITSSLLSQQLSHQLTLNKNGELSSAVWQSENTASSTQPPAPIFNLQGQWSAKTDETFSLSLQQSADIQSWLNLVSSADHQQLLTASSAIQAWNLELTLPKIISTPAALIHQLNAQGMMQIQITDFNIHDLATNTATIKKANLTFNLQTDINQQRAQQWLLSLDTLDLSGDVTKLAALDFSFKQTLTSPLTFACSIATADEDASGFDTCSWQGTLNQTLSADNMLHKTNLSITGEYQQENTGDLSINSQQSLSLATQQNNPLWPTANNHSHGEIIVQAQHVDNQWHWQLNLPFGLHSTSQYLDPLVIAEQKAQLSPVQWQLLPDWQLSGINNEITSSKPLTLHLEQAKLAIQNKRSEISHIAIDNAQASCNLDWLKLQYSPQLRSQQALSQLPLECHWQLHNPKGNWQQWPIPALNIEGKMSLSSLDIAQAKLNASMSLTGLANNLDLTLLAQHDFNHQNQQPPQQQGSAQLYLNNLKLDWHALGLAEMEALTQTRLLTGSLSAQGWFKWQQYQTDIFDDNSLAWRWQPDIMLRIDDFAGIYQEITTWEDIDIQLALRRPFYEAFRIDSQLSALSIHPGIEINNLLARSTTTISNDLSYALVVIEEVHTDVLGGRINVPLIRFDTRQDTNAFGIEVEGIDVAELAALEANAGINASGQLDGVLPIILSPAGPQVPVGSLYARAPGGVVQYRGQTADSLKNSDPSVNLAMQVLDDFRYDTLQTDVTYEPTGELNLGLKFQGHNPTFFDGQATHFNLNLDYNLLDLLASLRISNDIVQNLENKYR